MNGTELHPKAKPVKISAAVREIGAGNIGQGGAVWINWRFAVQVIGSSVRQRAHPSTRVAGQAGTSANALWGEMVERGVGEMFTIKGKSRLKAIRNYGVVAGQSPGECVQYSPE